MLLLKNVIIVAPFSDLDGQISDILIDENGLIENLGKNVISPTNTTVFEREGMCVSIGWIDVGVQTCDPGYEHREDFASTTRAAMAGGFTAVAPFPNTNPTIHSKSEVLYIKNKTQSYLVDFHPIGALSQDCKGKDIAEMLDMYSVGAIAFGDGKNSTQVSGLILRGLQYSKIFNGLIFNFPFEKSLALHGQMHEGLISTSLGLPGIPSLAEELMVERDLQLLEYSEGRLHCHNISTARSTDLVRQAKKRGLNVTASVAAINLCLNDTELIGFDSNLKVMPPLRDKSDCEALVEGLKDGTIDFISSNHTPVDTEGKDLEFTYAEFGIIGFETAFCLTNTFLNSDQDTKLSIQQLIELWAIKPRQVLGLEIPSITEGVMANLTIFHPDEEWTFTEKDIYSKSKNTPFVGTSFKGRVHGVVNKGQFWLRS